MISIYTKDFSLGKMAQICQISKKKKIQKICQFFMISFSR